MKKSKKEAILKEAVLDFISNTGANNIDFNDDAIKDHIECMDEDDVMELKNAMVVVSHFYFGI